MYFDITICPRADVPNDNPKYARSNIQFRWKMWSKTLKYLKKKRYQKRGSIPHFLIQSKVKLPANYNFYEFSRFLPEICLHLLFCKIKTKTFFFKLLKVLKEALTVGMH